MTIPPITETQKYILLLLYKFRFLTTHHLQKILNHKNPNGILEWLRDLREKGYVVMKYDRKKFGDNTKPAIFYLGLKARHILKKEEDVDVKVLNKIYREKIRSEKFINQCLSIAEVFLFFLEQKEPDEILHFFTQNELTGFDYFPEPLPNVYIAVETKDSTRRYFLDVFDDYTPAFVMRKRVKTYLTYSENGDWEANTNHEDFPAIMFVLPSESKRKHIHYYAKALLDKSYNDTLNLFLTTKDIIRFTKDKTKIWEVVE